MRLVRLIIAFFVILSLLITMAIGCGQQSIPGTFIDDMGRQVTIEEVPQRIVSHVPSITETLFALNLGEKVVGVSDYCNYPPEAQLKASVGNYFNPSIENIVALDPDLVLTDGHSENINQLDSIGITFIVLDPKDIDGILKDIRLLGKITGTEEEASSLCSHIEERIALVLAKVADAATVKVFYIFDATDLNNPWTAGPGSFIDSLITMGGGENVAAKANNAWSQFSIEEIVSADPDVILIDASHGSAVIAASELGEHPAWSKITAVEQNRIFTVDGDLVNRSGPRIILGLEEVARALHPELFD